MSQQRGSQVNNKRKNGHLGIYCTTFVSTSIAKTCELFNAKYLMEIYCKNHIE
jgi:hypothetical protein